MSGTPSNVLTDAVRTALGVEAAPKAIVMATYALEWDFLLDTVLPVFVPLTMSKRAEARRDEVAEYLETHECRTVIYADAGHIGSAMGASRVPITVVPVKHRTGFFHPKVLLALVDDGGRERLVVAAGSANLTELSWMEWVECAHVRSIETGEAIWFKDDLLAFVKHLSKQEGHTLGPCGARAKVQRFLEGTKQRKNLSSESTRELFIWNGDGKRPDLVSAILSVSGTWGMGGALEVVSPWFSPVGDVQVRELTTRLGTSTPLVVAPLDRDNRCLVPKDAVGSLGAEVRWARLPKGLARLGPNEDAVPRHLHAKLVRLYHPGARGSMVLVGSFNLTSAAFSTGGNLEAGFLVDNNLDPGIPWFEPEGLPVTYAPEMDTDESEGVPASTAVDLLLAYDWEDGNGEARWIGHEPPTAPMRLGFGSHTVLTVEPFTGARRLTPEEGQALRAHLLVNSPLLSVAREGSDSDGAYVLVTEVNAASKPSTDARRQLADAVAELLLDDEARRSRDRSGGGGQDDDDPDREMAEREGPAQDSIFDSYAALFQAMVAFEDDVRALTNQGDVKQARHRLESEWGRCLGDLLSRAEASLSPPEDTRRADPTTALLVCWCVEDVIDRLSSELRGGDLLLAATRVRARTSQLRSNCEERLQHDNADDGDFAKFLTWAHASFGKVKR